jgi:hypothetical protein
MFPLIAPKLKPAGDESTWRDMRESGQNTGCNGREKPSFVMKAITDCMAPGVVKRKRIDIRCPSLTHPAQAALNARSTLPGR